MAEKDLTTETPGKPGESEWLANLLDRALWPITNFVKELDAKEDEELDRLLSFLVPLMDTVEENFDVLDHILRESLGHIRIETTKKFRLFGGFRRGDFGKAFIEPPKPQAQASGGAA